MGQLTKSGELKGRVGEFVYKQVNGKTIVSARPKKHKVESSLVKKYQKKFSAAALLAQAVIKVETLKNIWASSKYATNAFNSVMKINAPLADKGKLTCENVITPELLDICLLQISIKGDLMHVSMDFQNPHEFELPVELYVFLYFPRQRVILPCVYKINKLDTEGFNQLYFEIPYEEIHKLYKKEPYPIGYLALSGKYTDHELCWTRTSALQAEDNEDLWEGDDDIYSYAIKSTLQTVEGSKGQSAGSRDQKSKV